MDRPGRDGRHAVYGLRQLLQLLLIRSLAGRGLSLTAIAPLVAAGNGELESQLARLDERPTSNGTLRDLREREASPALSNAAALESPPDLQSAPELIELLGAPIAQSAPCDEPSRRLGGSSGDRSAASPAAGSCEACAALLHDKTATTRTELCCALFFASRTDRHGAGGPCDESEMARNRLLPIRAKVTARELEWGLSTMGPWLTSRLRSTISGWHRQLNSVRPSIPFD